MEIELWGIEFNKRKNSTKIPDISGVKKEVVIKGIPDKCSVYAPSFFIKDAQGYSYIKAWDNYYWITNIAFDIDGAEYIECKIDVLASWREFIKKSIFFIDRCADDRYYNTDIFDTALSAEDGSEVFSTSVSRLFGGNNGGCFIVRITGMGQTGIATYAFPDLTGIGQLFNPYFDGYDDDQQPLEAIFDLVRLLICDPDKYIVAAYYSPLSYSYYSAVSDSEPVITGWFPTTVSARRLAQFVHNFEVTITKPNGIYTDFRRTDNSFSMYTLYIPCIGTVVLSPDIIESELKLIGSIDLLNGAIHYRLTADGSTVSSYEGKAYVNLDVSKGGSADTAGLIGTGIGTLAALEFGGASLAVGVQGLAKGMQITPSVNGSCGGAASIRRDPDVIMSLTQKHSAEFPLADYGRPCCKNLKLGDLSGFIKCGNASINISALDGIRDEINSYLNTGFFME